MFLGDVRVRSADHSPINGYSNCWPAFQDPTACVSDMDEVRFNDTFQAPSSDLSTKLFKRISGVFQHIAYNVLEHRLSQVHVLSEAGKGDLGFDHPELSRVTGRIGILGAECGAEGIDFVKRHAVCFRFQLAADRQVCFFAEEIFGEVNDAFFITRIRSNPGGTEHISCVASLR